MIGIAVGFFVTLAVTKLITEKYLHSDEAIKYFAYSVSISAPITTVLVYLLTK